MVDGLKMETRLECRFLWIPLQHHTSGCHGLLPGWLKPPPVLPAPVHSQKVNVVNPSREQIASCLPLLKAWSIFPWPVRQFLCDVGPSHLSASALATSYHTTPLREQTQHSLKVLRSLFPLTPQSYGFLFPIIHTLPSLPNSTLLSNLNLDFTSFWEASLPSKVWWGALAP
jgi:hypothetical protein